MKADGHDRRLVAFAGRSGEHAGGAVNNADRRFERLLLEDARALGDRCQRRRDLAQGVERGVQSRRLTGDDLEDARVLDRDACHRAEITQRPDVLLAEA